MAGKTVEELSERARPLYKRASEAAQRQNYDYAIELMIQVLELEPAFLDGRKLLRSIQMRQFQSQNIVSRKMASMKAMTEAMKAQVSLKKSPALALIEAEKALNIDPTNATALGAAAEAAETMELPETAAFLLESAVQQKPNDVKALKRLGALYGRVGENDKAYKAYERVLKLDPADADAFKAMKDATAEGALKKGGWNEEGDYRSKMKDKEEAKAIEQQSRVVKSEEMVANLINETYEKLAQDPKNLALARQLARLYAQNNEFENALGLFDQVLQLQGNDPALEKEIADTRMKQLGVEISKKETALQQTPGNEALKQELAKACQDRDNLLLEECEKRVQRYPNDLGFRYELGQLYFQRDNIKGAIQQLQLAIKNPQLRVNVLNYLGQCFMKQKLMDIAIRQFATAESEIPTMDDLKKEVLYNLGDAHEMKGDKGKAGEYFQKVYEVDMGYRDVAKRLGLE
ncbi:MAG: tetratricopeptide repeat protein [Verrucomicrobia bacterium]|nr:tetratricopeptide repeat protein [Verrucomicrobiota bacterium]